MLPLRRDSYGAVACTCKGDFVFVCVGGRMPKREPVSCLVENAAPVARAHVLGGIEFSWVS